jgi:hypothetical protein
MAPMFQKPGEGMLVQLPVALIAVPVNEIAVMPGCAWTAALVTIKLAASAR